MSRVIANIKDILTYSDSEFLELLIAFLHFLLLPLAIYVELGMQPIVQALAVAGGLFQLYAVGIRNLTCRYISCYVAVLVSLFTVETYYTEGLLEGSRYGWLMISVAAIINLFRVGKQWTHKQS